MHTMLRVAALCAALADRVFLGGRDLRPAMTELGDQAARRAAAIARISAPIIAAASAAYGIARARA